MEVHSVPVYVAEFRSDADLRTVRLLHDVQVGVVRCHANDESPAHLEDTVFPDLHFPLTIIGNIVKKGTGFCDAWQGTVGVSKSVTIDSHELHQLEEQTAIGSMVVTHVSAELQLTASATAENERKVGNGVVISVFESGAVHDDAVFEESAVSVRQRFQPIQEPVELPRVPLIDSVEVRDDFSVADKMREVVELFIDANEVVDSATLGVSHHERGDSGGIGPECNSNEFQHRSDPLSHVPCGCEFFDLGDSLLPCFVSVGPEPSNLLFNISD